ncbi:MAG: DUF3369 domain-containing protein [Spirochaetales bacterium]|nr:DUF3369 domain-containing protein [Spirochaetales bacterium]
MTSNTIGKKFVFKKKNEKQDVHANVIEASEWKILIVDDDESVHTLTQMVLAKYTFKGLPLKFIDAYSGRQAIEIMKKEDNVAVILLDVVMETEDAGLVCVKEIREILENLDVRIILRTGQPGSAPVKEVIVKYEINDYKEKTELSSQKLFTSITTSLRDYSLVSSIKKAKIAFSKLFDVSNQLLKLNSLSQLNSEVLTGVSSIFDNDKTPPVKCSSLWAMRKNYENKYSIKAGTGDYVNSHKGNIWEAVPPEIEKELASVIKRQEKVFLKDGYIGYYKTKKGDDSILIFNWDRIISKDDKLLIRSLSSNLKAVFENLSLINEVSETQREVINTFSEVVEGRSIETVSHIKRVTDYACQIATTMGLSEADINRIRLVSPMHDIGKVGTPDSILKKPGKLTNEEYSIMQKHAEVGYVIFKRSSLETMTQAAVVAHQHHEKWNGKGYPLGITGEEIHPFSRIVALADVFDALTNKRCYKEPWPLEKVLEIVKEERGEHFAPNVVDAFLKDLSEHEKILKKHFTVV